MPTLKLLNQSDKELIFVGFSLLALHTRNKTRFSIIRHNVGTNQKTFHWNSLSPANNFMIH